MYPYTPLSQVTLFLGKYVGRVSYKEGVALGVKVFPDHLTDSVV